MPYLLTTLIVILVIVAIAWWRPATTTVFEFERGLRYRRGKFVKVLGPGAHWMSRRSGRISKVDVRAFYLVVPGQELLSLDGIAIKVSLAAHLQVVDPNLAVNTVQDYRAAVYAVLQLACRDLVSAMKVEDLLASRPQLGTSLMEKGVAPIAEMGVKLSSVEVRDLMMPGDLKKIFAQEVQARKEGLAALERARGETAARRGRVPALAIQVKTALSLDRQGFAVARMSFPEGKARQHPAFVYAIVFVADATVEAAWIAPSADFNRLSYRGAGRRGKGIELPVMASPTRQDRWSAFRCGRMAMGPKLGSLIDALPAGGRPPRVPGAHLLLRRE